MLLSMLFGGAATDVAASLSSAYRTAEDQKLTLLPYGVGGFATPEEIRLLGDVYIQGYRPWIRAHGRKARCAKCNTSSPAFTAGELRALETHAQAGPIMARIMARAGVYAGPICLLCRRPA